MAEIGLEDVIGAHMEVEDELATGFWASLKANGRVTKRPHVTIVHKSSLPEAAELWERCMGLHRMPLPPLFRFALGSVLWNDRVMAVKEERLELDAGDGENVGAREFVSELAQGVRCIDLKPGVGARGRLKGMLS